MCGSLHNASSPVLPYCVLFLVSILFANSCFAFTVPTSPKVVPSATTTKQGYKQQVTFASKGGPAKHLDAFYISDRQAASDADEQNTEEQNPPLATLHRVDDRVTIISPPGAVKHLEATKIYLEVHTPGITRLREIQSLLAADGTSSAIDGTYAELPILTDSDGRKYVSVVPSRLGKVLLTFVGEYSDGGQILQKAEIDVEPSNKKIQHLFVGRSGSGSNDPVVIHAFMDTRGGAAHVVVKALYEGIEESVPINPSFVRFDVRSLNGKRVFDIDNDTGTIVPKQLGYAPLRSTFGGASQLSCVVVSQNEDAMSFDPAACQNLMKQEKAADMR